MGKIEAFQELDKMKDKDGWVAMSKILSMTKEPENVKKGLWFMKKLGLIQCRKKPELDDLEYRLTKLAYLLGITWKNADVNLRQRKVRV